MQRLVNVAKRVINWISTAYAFIIVLIVITAIGAVLVGVLRRALEDKVESEPVSCQTQQENCRKVMTNSCGGGGSPLLAAEHGLCRAEKSRCQRLLQTPCER